MQVFQIFHILIQIKQHMKIIDSFIIPILTIWESIVIIIYKRMFYYVLILWKNIVLCL